MKRFLSATLMLLITWITLSGQNGFLDLKNDYPLLFDKFEAELVEQRADYIFAIDVSGTMSNYKDTVIPALQEFFSSLQEGDYVSVKKFGAETDDLIGGIGKIGPETLKNLKDATSRLYDTPSTDYEKEKFYRWTDLDNMLHAVATDMQQFGRNRLKFVFIITDFLHDPSPVRRGKEDWEGCKNRFATEQAGNNIFVFALQLPGSGRDLEKVRKVLPKEFGFTHVPIVSGSALSEWFNQRKNAILLDKFKALIKQKIQPAELILSPKLSLDGDLSLGVSWTPNPVYDRIRIDEVCIPSGEYTFNPKPIPSNNESLFTADAGSLSSRKASLLTPRFDKFCGNAVMKAGYDVPYMSELNHLGFETPVIEASAPLENTLFCYPLPFWLFSTILALILLYILLVIRAFVRNGNARHKINGTFDVTHDGISINPNPVRANSRDLVDIGAGAAFLPIPGCGWKISIRVKRYNPFLQFYKAPSYIAHLDAGLHFKVNGRKYLPQHKPTVSRYARITIDTYQIRWTRK